MAAFKLKRYLLHAIEGSFAGKLISNESLTDVSTTGSPFAALAKLTEPPPAPARRKKPRRRKPAAAKAPRQAAS